MGLLSHGDSLMMPLVLSVSLLCLLCAPAKGTEAAAEIGKLEEFILCRGCRSFEGARRLTRTTQHVAHPNPYHTQPQHSRRSSNH